MQTGPITWLLRTTGLKRLAAGGAPETVKGWTIPRTPVEVLAQSLATDRDWLVEPRRVHRRGISIGWKRRLDSRYPGITLRIDDKDRPLTMRETALLAKSLRAFLAIPAKAGSATPKILPVPLGEGDPS
jgi:hypothetical protein